MKVLKNISNLVTLDNAYKKDGRHLNPSDLSIIEDGAMVFDEDKILWIGKTSELPSNYQTLPSESLKFKTVIPELVDSHTHLVFGGNRAQEYFERLNGVTYQDIAARGGGILTTVKGTHFLSKRQLFDSACKRIETISSYGVGAIEIKSGYALDFEKEYELSHIIDELKKRFSPRVKIFNTFMAAHSIPKEFSNSATYMNKVVIPLLKKLGQEKILDAVDIFHEENYFDESDCRLLFDTANEFNIKIKTHADEFKDNGGASLAVEYNALSADHLLRTGEEGIVALSNSKTVATLLPGTGFFLGKPQANARELLNKGAKVAIASDFNPGSCFCDNVLLVASISAPTLKMNMAEVWASITLNAAHALGLNDQGALVPSLRPRFKIFDCAKIEEITYSWGKNFNLPFELD